MKTTIVTLVPPEPNAGWLDECVVSVRDAAHLEPLQHATIACDDLYSGRKETYCVGGLVGCVDYDDRIAPEAVRRCREAIEQTGAGIAFTWQRLVDGDGKELGLEQAPISPRDVCSRPNSIHHFALMQSALLPGNLFEVIEAMGVQMSVDWVVRAYLALRHGAVQVPMAGYDWRQHDGQTSKARNDEFLFSVRRARALIKTWAPFDQGLFQPFKVM